MNFNKKIITLSILILSLASCKKYLQTDLTDWTDFTHGNNSANYSELFTENKINTIEIKIENKHWNSLLENIDEIAIDIELGNPNSSSDELIVSALPKLKNIPSTVIYNDIKWYQVGFRFKGLSSLQKSWANNILKMPIKLAFNKFGSIYEGIENQRFYGFEKMTFANNISDPSQIKEKLAYQLLEDFGIPVPKSTFAELYINYGEGKKYFGLYTMIETVEDQMIERLYGSNTGNCYKPTGTSATLQENINYYDLNQKTNIGSSISDVKNLTKILYDDLRNSDATKWRKDLENVFDVELFLKFLAGNTVMNNWDTYGKASHNYYLYTQPDNNKIVFIPWDMIETFLNTPNEQPFESHKLDQSNVSEKWPLIKFLIADEIYFQKYKNYVQEFNENIFIPSNVHTKIDDYFSLVKTSIEKEEKSFSHHNDIQEVTDFVQLLKTNIYKRHTEVKSFY